MSHPLIIDSFAGGGGASTGIAMALGRSPDIAINHNATALAMHEANHPDTLHLSKNIWQVDPMDAVGNRPVGLAWFSPDCKHFSKAKGGKPVKRNIRDLAWTVVLWARRARPAVIIVENVEEFEDWGPLTERAPGVFVPCPDRAGETFKVWVKDLKRLGYRVEWKQLVAADYGAPTTRKRLFLIARRDGKPIAWPRPTHAKPATDGSVPAGMHPWRTAAEIIDWSLPCPSIFETAEEIMAKHGVRAIRPLAENTMKRVARGVQRYVLEAAEPFVVKFQTGSTGSPIGSPLPTVTANSFHKRPGGAAPVGVVVPVVTAAQHGGSNRGADKPMRTVAASHKDQHAVIAPSLISVAHGDSGGRREYGPGEPLGTVTASPERAVVAPTLIQTGYGERPGQEPRAPGLDKPLGTVVAGGAKHALVAAFMAQHNNDSRRIGGVNPGKAADEPISTITATGSQQGLVSASLMNMKGPWNRGQQDARDPVPTICASTTHAYTVAAFLQKYYGTGGQDQTAADPLHTLTTKARLGLVTVEIGGEPFVIADIGMRMLTPRELFNAQGFPSDYVIDRALDGRAFTKSEQIACVGNSVCPPVAAAIVAANCADLMVRSAMEAAE